MTWENGDVGAPAHEPVSGDLEAVLGALGGTMPLCLAIVDAWPVLMHGLMPQLHRFSGTHPGPALSGPQESVEDLDEWLRPGADVLAPAASRSLSPSDARAVRDFFDRRRRHGRATVLGAILPPAFEAMRLAAAVERAGYGGRDRQLLEQTVARLARDCCRAAGIDPPVRVPLHWAGRVWARGAALVDGNFVVDLRPPVEEGEPWQAITPSGTRPWFPT